MSTETLAAKHALRGEGKPEGLYSHAKAGRGVCWCGATSRVLLSDAARKRWHKDHKAKVR